MKKIIALAMLPLALALVSCEDYVQTIEPLIDQVEDDRLTSEAQVPFLIIGVQTRFADTFDDLSIQTSGLSDQFFFDLRIEGASFPSYLDIDNGDIKFDNNSVDGVYNDIGELRFFSDDLLRRSGDISFEDADLGAQAQYVANLYGGIARFMYAAYFGLNPTEGGGIIDNGPFVPSADMFAQAISKFEAALANTSDDAEKRLVNSLIARAHLYNGNYGAAATAAASGMTAGDDPFNGLHAITASNSWYFASGRGRTQFAADGRFSQYVSDDPNEGNRLPLFTKEANDGSGVIFYFQDLFVARESAQPFITWQENELMLAETDLRNGGGDPLGRINAVRASHGLAGLAAADLDVLYMERDKELFTTGARLVDQRRFGQWHLGAGTWQFLPITQNERNNNPNL